VCQHPLNESLLLRIDISAHFGMANLLKEDGYQNEIGAVLIAL
jgi:hypothetical protein